MCRNIRPLFNFEPPASSEEVRAASLQFVRKVSGFARPSRVNAGPFDEAVAEITAVTRRLMDRLETSAPPRSREEDARRARAAGWIEPAVSVVVENTLRLIDDEGLDAIFVEDVRLLQPRARQRYLLTGIDGRNHAAGIGMNLWGREQGGEEQQQRKSSLDHGTNSFSGE